MNADPNSKHLGRHVIAEFYNCKANLAEVSSVKAAMLSSAKKARAHVVKSVFHQFNPHGVSGVVVIAESHLAIHTWPELSYAAVESFTCGYEASADLCVEYMKRHLKPSHATVKAFDRGSKAAINKHQRSKSAS